MTFYPMFKMENTITIKRRLINENCFKYSINSFLTVYVMFISLSISIKINISALKTTYDDKWLSSNTLF